MDTQSEKFRQLLADSYVLPHICILPEKDDNSLSRESQNFAEYYESLSVS